MDLRIALLRAVNVGGHNKVAMRDLRELLNGLGMEDPQTLLQSGNLVFRSRKAVVDLEELLELAAQKQLGLSTQFFVRTAAEWKAIIAANPLAEEAKREPSHLLVYFLKQIPDPAAAAALKQAIPGRELVHLVSRQVYVSYPDGIGRSRLTSLLIERKLGTRATGRNWNTVLKLGVSAEVL